MMKKNVWCLALVLALMLAACGHTHAAVGGWEVDGTEHWKLCECGEKCEDGVHELNDLSVCTVCGAELTDWGDSVDVIQYDEQGNAVRYRSFDSAGDLVSDSRIDYTYDADGSVLMEMRYENEVLVEESTYENGVQSTLISYWDDGTRHVSVYDDEGNLLSTISYDTEDKIFSEIYSEYAHDADGIPYEVKSTVIDADGSKYVSEYNEQGDQIGWITYDPDGNMENNERYEYTYLEEGRISTKKTYSGDVLVQEMLYTFVTTDDGWMNYPGTIIDYHEDGTKTVSEYNENDELVSQTNYDADGNVIE